MDIKQAIEALNNSEYTDKGSSDLFEQMEKHGLVAVFGASDDLMEFRGAIHDEFGAFEGSQVTITKDGLLINKCECDDCPNFNSSPQGAFKIEALWDIEGSSWVYETKIPHETFDVLEDGEKYCRGIVFYLAMVG